MKRVRIERKTKERVLLTEILPYEVPMLFSNEGYYLKVLDKKFSEILEQLGNLAKKSGSFTIPYNYEVRRSSSSSTRLLSVIHPITQLKFVEFYRQYEQLLVHLCSRSPISLRRVSRVAKFYYRPDMTIDEDSLVSEEAEVVPDMLDHETRYLKSYFSYEPIDLIYKFFDRHDFRRLEQKYDFLVEFDVNKCFYNIYTHSLSWAIKTKEIAKKNIGKKSFEDTFDRLMQESNYNETNGIVVGPEASRIFAEIILQRIDLNVLQRIEQAGLKYGVDLEIRRYIDDYFVFANDPSVGERVKAMFSEVLLHFKLYLNSGKGGTRSSPFLTSIGAAKWQTKQLIRNFLENVTRNIKAKLEGNLFEDMPFESRQTSYRSADSLIRDFQCIAKTHGVTYDVISKDVIRDIKATLLKISRWTINAEAASTLRSTLIVLLDVAFYAYSVNVCASTTFKLAQIVVVASRISSNLALEDKMLIQQKIFKEADFALSNLKRKSRGGETSVDALNLLICLNCLEEAFRYSEARLRELFGLKTAEDFDRLGYFEIVILLYYIRNDNLLSGLKTDLVDSVLTRFRHSEEVFVKAEYAMLFFDYLSCPYIGKTSKIDLVLGSGWLSNSTKAGKFVKEISNGGSWFMNWDTVIDLERVLKKKEWAESY